MIPWAPAPGRRAASLTRAVSWERGAEPGDAGLDLYDVGAATQPGDDLLGLAHGCIQPSGHGEEPQVREGEGSEEKGGDVGHNPTGRRPLDRASRRGRYAFPAGVRVWVSCSGWAAA